MKRDKIKQFLSIITAFAEGKKIEYQHEDGIWREQDDLLFCNSIIKYRVKPEPKLVPFTFEDINLFDDKWFKNKIVINGSFSGNLFKPIHSNINGLSFYINEHRFYNYADVLLNFEFLDGSPCGKYIEEK